MRVIEKHPRGSLMTRVLAAAQVALFSLLLVGVGLNIGQLLLDRPGVEVWVVAALAGIVAGTSVSLVGSRVRRS